MPKAKASKTDIDELKKLFENIDENRKPLAEKLCKQAVFMEKTLNELQNLVNSEGAIVTTTNGNGFDVMSEHPAQKSYNTMINRYTALMAKLIDMLPKEDNAPDELLDFIGGVKK
jgi:hypothetical protein